MNTVSEQDAGRILDIEQARAAAITEYVGRNLVERKSKPGVYIAAADMTGPAVSVGDAAADAAAAHVGDAELETRVRNIVYDREQHVVSRRLAARQIITLVRQASPRTYTPWLTLSAREVQRVLDECPDVVVQIQDARDETTGHPAASGDCESADCVHRDRCVLLVSTAWADGSYHMAPTWPVTVRIEAAA